MDPITIGLLLGAGTGLLKGNANVKKQAENDKYRKMAVAMSPWTGMGDPGGKDLPGPLESAASGAAMGGQVGGMFGGAPAAGASTMASQTPQVPQYAGQNMLGGQDMASQLGNPQFMQQPGQIGSPGTFGNFKYSLMANNGY